MSTPELTIAQQVEALNGDLASQMPPEVMGAFVDEIGSLSTRAVPADVPAPGAPMPDGDLLDGHGEPTTFEVARDGKPAVVVFYRGAWCPYCNLTLRAYQQQLVPALDERGVKLIAINPQKPDGSLTMQETNALTFTVLSDPGSVLMGKMGILTEPGEGVQEASAKLGLDIPGDAADGTWTMPMPTTAVVDAGGTIAWIDVHPVFATRSEPTEIIAAVDALDD